MKRAAAALLVSGLTLMLTTSIGAAGDKTLSVIADLAGQFCETGLESPEQVAAQFGKVLSLEDRGAKAAAFRRSLKLRRDNHFYRVDLTAFAGNIRRVRAEAHQALDAGKDRPFMLVDVDGSCAPIHGRQIDYDGDGRAEWLTHFDSALQPDGTREALNPPVPAGSDPGGVLVVQIDSGVNYLLPEIAERLARDDEGKILGYDYWDLDARPFDLDTARSPFFPLRHGTTVASVFLREAPAARLLPYRYPRPDLSRMEALLDDAAEKGARIVMMPLGSTRAEDWQAFAQTAKRHGDILFIISAGNDGRDIDAQPLYPANFPLDNTIVVTSSDSFGRLAEGSNWGREHVDLMAPGEAVEVIDHRGARGMASGSSYVVPRVAALAARLLDLKPDWNTMALKQAIRKRTGPSLERGSARVNWGWMPNPADDG
ncbi:S8 family serine peptidase [Pelagibius sp. Alg239-R121]|uniref:S8 family serine peptidase n=1 Tax=Pelagibius sp. Alg239-R121 TaxID=2993448 RepID=UPI0024A788CC|nr:S8 family serine peptidase [Pelagibius sp. Alg239-R121]